MKNGPKIRALVTYRLTKFAAAMFHRGGRGGRSRGRGGRGDNRGSDRGSLKPAKTPFSPSTLNGSQYFSQIILDSGATRLLYLCLFFLYTR